MSLKPRAKAPPFRIKTAEEWQRELRNLEVAPLEDVRDDVVSLIRNSGMSFKEVEERGGPKAATISRWQAREVKNPQFRTLRWALQAIGSDFFVGKKL